MAPSGPRPTARPGSGPGRGRSRTRTGSRDRVVPPGASSAGPASDPDAEPTVALDASTGAPPPAGKGGAGSSRGRTAPDNASTPEAGRPPSARSGGTRTAVARTAAARTASASGAVLHRAVRANLTARALALVVVVLVLTISYATSLRIYFAQAHDIASTKAEIAQRQATITDLQGQIARWNDSAYVQTQARERLGWLVPGETGYTVVGADGKPLGGGLTLESATGDEPAPQQRMWWDRMWGSVKAADKPTAKKADPAKRAPVSEDSKPR
jgi:cell division protein FtsB